MSLEMLPLEDHIQESVTIKNLFNLYSVRRHLLTPYKGQGLSQQMVGGLWDSRQDEIRQGRPTVQATISQSAKCPGENIKATGRV